MARMDWVVVPSIWWETGPLVVMEAFQYGRPVICSDIGGMSEKVTDGERPALPEARPRRPGRGHEARRRDPRPVGGAARRDSVRPLRTMDDHVGPERLYKELLADRTGANLHALPSEELASA